jgi:hypothetical protein
MQRCACATIAFEAVGGCCPPALTSTRSNRYLKASEKSGCATLGRTLDESVSKQELRVFQLVA